MLYTPFGQVAYSTGRGGREQKGYGAQAAGRGGREGMWMQSGLVRRAVMDVLVGEILGVVVTAA